MDLSIIEIYFCIFIALVGLVGNVIQIIRQAAKSARLKWSIFLYGASLLVLLSGFLTPPDLLSNLLMTGPFLLVYSMFLKTYVYKRF